MIYQSFALSSSPPAQRFQHFCNVVDDLFSPTSCSADRKQRSRFDGGIEVADLGHLKIANVSTNAVQVTRRLADIAKVDQASYLVKFQLSGYSTLEQSGKVAQLTPGDFVICSTADPYRLSFDSPYTMSVLAIDADRAQAMYRGMDQLLGQRMCGSDPTCRLLSSFVSTVAGQLSSLPDSMADRVENNLLDLLGGVVSAAAMPTAKCRQPATQTRLAIKQYLEANLCNRRLRPAMIASTFGISTRYLHKLFADEPETLTRYIRSRRLNASRAMLADPANNHLSITEIALHWGFYDLSHMTHTFTECYHMSPSAMRAQQIVGLG